MTYKKYPKPITARQREFINLIVYNRLDREMAYCQSHGVRPSAFEEGRLQRKSYSEFRKPQVQEYYMACMEEIRDAEVQKGVWTKQLATDKLMRLVEHAEETLYDADAKLNAAILNAILLPIKELNQLEGLLVQKMDINADSQITFVGEDSMLD